MRINLILFLLAVLSLGGCAHDQQAAKSFGNMTYFMNQPLFKDRATLVDGKHDEEFLNVFYDDKYVYGDFNHDGLKDAAVIIVENYGGNASYYELAFLINDGTKLIHRASQHLEEHAIINSVKERNGKVVVDMYVHQKGDCHAGPSKRVRRVYEYPGPQFPKGQA